MSDLISRQAVMHALEKCHKQCCREDDGGDEWIHFETIVNETECIPSAQPEQRWIPCSERLPKEGEVVLTQAKFKDDVKMAVSSRIDYNYWTTWGTRDINIIAWMPLPEPYREGEQE